MASQQNISARRIAVSALNQCDPRRNFVTAILNDLLSKTEQRQRATDLVLGTLRNRTCIDMVITAFSGRPVKNIPDKLLNILRVATYELIFNPHTPDYSIVNEAVNTTSKIAGKKQTGFTNAVLRQIERHIVNREYPVDNSESGKIIPQNHNTGCLFDTSFLPDPKSSPEEYLSTTFSLPRWLVSSWLAEFGYQQTFDICFGSNRKPSVYIRPNPLKITISDLFEMMSEHEIEAQPIPESSMLKIKSPKSISLLPGFNEGLFSIQDLIASQPVTGLNPQSGWRILDLCSAPGTKAMQLAEVTGNMANITATDIDHDRLEMIHENIRRLGIKCVNVVEHDELPKIVQKAGLFDAILIDAPCSNSGVLAKRVEARYRLVPDTASKLAKTQIDLLEKSTRMLNQTGKICYSTCSIMKAENSDLIRKFLSAHSDFILDSEVLTSPSAKDPDHDGGYFAILTRQEK